KTPSYSELRKRGEKTCKIIYGNKYDKLISNVKSFFPDLVEWLEVEGYGKVLRRNRLTLKKRELCIIAILTVLKSEDQSLSHNHGCLIEGIRMEIISELVDYQKLINNSFSSFGRKILRTTKRYDFLLLRKFFKYILIFYLIP